MGYFQQMLETTYGELLTFPIVGAELIRRRLSDRGMNLTEAQIESIRNQLAGLPPDSIRLDLDDEQLPAKMEYQSSGGTIQLDVADADIELEQIIRDLSGALEAEIPKLGQSIADELSAELLARVSEYAAERIEVGTDFQIRLEEKWRSPLQILDVYISIAREAGEEFIQEYQEGKLEARGPTLDVLFRMHARGCQVAEEVLHMIRGGFADGAHARWRTLHELAVVAAFLAAKGDDCAEAYALHDGIESYKAANLYREYYERLGYEPLPEEEFREVKVNYESLIERYGQDYKGQYGWAAKELGISNPSFAQIEKHVKLDHLRPHYKLASHNVHANPKGLLYRMGLYPDSPDILLAGPTNTGFADPAHGTAISLGQLCTWLLAKEPNFDRLIQIQVLHNLMGVIGEKFLSVQDSFEAKSR